MNFTEHPMNIQIGKDAWKRSLPHNIASSELPAMVYLGDDVRGRFGFSSC